jgi:hypothetical protein
MRNQVTARDGTKARHDANPLIVRLPFLRPLRHPVPESTILQIE